MVYLIVLNQFTSKIQIVSLWHTINLDLRSHVGIPIVYCLKLFRKSQYVWSIALHLLQWETVRSLYKHFHQKNKCWNESIKY